MSKSKIGVLGGGVSSLAFSHFYEKKVSIIEKESTLGGLCRSFIDDDGVAWDIGPHITFSKNQEILEFIISLTEMNELKRSNRIIHDGRFIKYPFENDLSSLSDKDRDYCLNTFLDNPYENYPSTNMLEFFYEIFGEGITRLFLEPYNRKIWKYETSFMDKQMVERIPKPPPEDIIASAKGEQTEGYLHQLYFHYPEKGGFQTIVNSLAKKIENKAEVYLENKIVGINLSNDIEIVTDKQKFNFDKIISTIPIHELLPIINPEPPSEIMEALSKLKYNSIHITCLKVKGDWLGDNFAITIADPDIIFHRLSRLNFLGEHYAQRGYTNIMVETTFRKGLKEDLDHTTLEDKIIKDLKSLDIVNVEKIENIFTNTFKYAYVIYDQNHRKNTDLVLDYLRSVNITPLGRFGTFEYINSDKAIELAKELAEKF
ncbi:FAD-dependent oxidoreductase [Acidimicrobiaceae bacterium]|nr:FAD-dependent oxidoreductase [Acidimicrobiaceae bacterium]